MYERLETKAELSERLYQIRKAFRYGHIVAVLIVWWIFGWGIGILSIIPLWLIMAATYTAVDNHHEEKYNKAIRNRRREVF